MLGDLFIPQGQRESLVDQTLRSLGMLSKLGEEFGAGRPMGATPQAYLMRAGAKIGEAGRTGGAGGYTAEAVNQVLDMLSLPQKVALATTGNTIEDVEQAGGRAAESLGWNKHVGQFAANVLTDPTTYMGFGLAGRGAKLASRAGLSVNNPFMDVLRTANRAETSISRGAEEAAGAFVGALQSGLVPVNRELGKLFPNLPRWTEFAQKSKATTDAIQWLQERHGIDLREAQRIWAGSSPGTRPSAGGGLDSLYGLLPQDLQARFSKDELKTLLTNATSQNMTTFDEAAADYLRGVRQSMGLQADNKFMQMYDRFTQWWKRQATGSIAYLGTNLTGGMLFNALEGVNPADTVRDIWRNRRAIWEGAEFEIDDAARMAQQTGAPTPETLNFDVRSAINTNAGTDTSFKPNLIDVGVTSGLGAIGAAASGEDPMLGALVGGATGAALRPLTSKTRQISQGIETALRQRAYVRGMGKELVESLGEIEDVILDAVAQRRAPTASRPNRPGSFPSPVFADAFMDTARQSQGQFNPLTLADEMINSARMRPEVADEAARQLDDILYRASRAGVGTANAANFDYQDLSNLERLLTQAFPFATWYLKAAPFYAQKAAGRPGLATVPTEWGQEAHENREELGLTSRVEGALPNPIARTLMSTVLGRDVGDVYQNPFSQFVPFADAGRGLANLEYADNPAEFGLGLLDALGLGLNPALDTASRIVGIQGTDAPAEGIPLRVAGVVDALTGVNLNAGGQAIESTIRENLTGREPTNLGENAIAKRLDELALRDTGKTIGSGDKAVAPYVRAKANQSGALWEQAKQEVEAERNVQAVGGFVSPMLRGQTVVSPQESDIRGASLNTLVPPKASRELRDLAKENPKGDAPIHLVQAVLDANSQILEHYGAEEMPPEIAERLADPTNENIAWIATQIFDWEARHTDPLLRGYSGSGSPEQRRLQAQQAELRTAGQIPVPMTRRGYGVNPFALPRQLRQQEQEAILQKNGLLQEYLGWKRLNPEGTPEQFLAQMN